MKILVKKIFLLAILIFGVTPILHSQTSYLEWVSTYSNSLGYKSHIAVEDGGNVYVAGENFHVVKYNPNGQQVWARVKNNSTVVGTVLDGMGNLIVIGSSGGSSILTVKYNPGGDELWTRVYPTGSLNNVTASAVVVDDTNNVYVTGYGGDGHPFPWKVSIISVSIKYKPNGDFVWDYRLFGSAPGTVHSAQALTLGENGNVYVSGGYAESSVFGSGWIYKYQHDGQLVMSELNNLSFSAISLYSDANGNLYTAGYGGFSNLDVAKFNSTLQNLWSVNLSVGNLSGLSDQPVAKMKRDKYGNLIIAAQSFDASSGYDYYVTKLDSNGVQLWTSKYNYSGNSVDVLRDLALDSAGSIYVTGYSEVGNTGSFTTIKYTSDGDSARVLKYDGRGNSIQTDISGGKVYVSGGNNSGMITIKYSLPLNIQNVSTQIPENFSLYQNYPNPFNPTTNIRFDIRKQGLVTLKVYDILGKEVTTLVNESLQPGTYEADFDATGLTSGVYFYRLETEGFGAFNIMMLVK